MTWVDAGGLAFDPDVARGEDLGLGWHLDDLRLNEFLQTDVVGLSEDEPDLSLDQTNHVGELWFSLVLFVVLKILRLGGSLLGKDLDGQDGKVVLTNDDLSSVFGDVLFSLVDLQSGDVDDVDNNDLVVGAEVL